jgi:hypothetical protein
MIEYKLPQAYINALLPEFNQYRKPLKGSDFYRASFARWHTEQTKVETIDTGADPVQASILVKTNDEVILFQLTWF